MKNYKNLIKIIIITPALVACGVFAYKKLQQNTTGDEALVVIQSSSSNTQAPVSYSTSNIKSTMVSNSKVKATRQSNKGSTTCARQGDDCSSSIPCCGGGLCTSGKCQ